MLAGHEMNETHTEIGGRFRGGSLLALLAILFAALSILCHQAYQPHTAMWANDSQLGTLTDTSVHTHPLLQGIFTGAWADMWWIGFEAPAASPTVGMILLAATSPEMYLKILTPFSMLLLGFSAWVLFRQLKFAPMVCVLGGVAAGLNMHCFSNGCWGLGGWNTAIAMIFLAVAALVTDSIRQFWIRAILAGLAVGMSVMEGYDSGAILSVYVGIFTVFFCWITESTVPKRMIKSVQVGALVVLFAGLISCSTLYTLVGTQVSGVAGMGQTAEEKQRRWPEATMWSLPKLETLRVIIPGIFGYRLDEFSTPPDPLFVSWGQMGGWPEKFLEGLSDKSSAYWGRVGEDPAIANLESSNPTVRAAAIAAYTDNAEYIDAMRSDNLDRRTQLVDSVKSQTQRRHSGNGEYAGVLTALFAIFALVNSFRGKTSPYTLLERRMVWFWGLATLFSLMAAWGRFSFLYALLYQLPGVSSIRNPIKFMHAFVITWVILAGFGLEAFSRCYLRSPAKPAAAAPPRPPNGWWQKLTLFDKGWFLGLLLAVAGSLVAYLNYAGSKPDLVKYLMHQFNAPQEERMSRIADFSIAEARWFVFLFVLSAGVVLSAVAAVWAKRWTWAPWTLLCGIMVFDLSRADLPWVRYFNYDQKYSMNEVTQVLMDKPYEHRVVARLNPRGGYDLPGEANFGAVIHWWIENDFPYHDIQSLEIDQMPRPPLLDLAYLSAFPYRGDFYYSIGGSAAFSADEIKDLPKLVNRWRQQSDPVSAFLWQGLTNSEQAWLATNQPSGPNSNRVQEVVVQALNKIIGGRPIYEPGRFQGIALRPETSYIMQQTLASPIVAYLNRFLLEDAYPLELSRDHIGPATRLWQLTNTRYLLAAAALLPALNEIGDPQHHSFRIVKQFNLLPKPGYTFTQTPGLTNVADAGDLNPQIADKGNCALIENTNVLPRAKLYPYWLTPPNDQTALRALTAPQWDPAQSVLVSSDTPVPPPSAAPGTEPGAVRITSYRPKDIQLQTSAKTSSVLLYNDRTSRDWRVWVDGKKSQLLRCNYIMRGVFVPAGEHAVQFRYEPTLVPLGITLSAFVVGILLAVYLLCGRILLAANWIWSRLAGKPPSKTA
jgi:hypothetical protein